MANHNTLAVGCWGMCIQSHGTVLHHLCLLHTLCSQADRTLQTQVVGCGCSTAGMHVVEAIRGPAWLLFLLLVYATVAEAGRQTTDVLVSAARCTALKSSYASSGWCTYPEQRSSAPGRQQRLKNWAQQQHALVPTTAVALRCAGNSSTVKICSSCLRGRQLLVLLLLLQKADLLAAHAAAACRQLLLGTLCLVGSGECGTPAAHLVQSSGSGLSLCAGDGLLNFFTPHFQGDPDSRPGVCRFRAQSRTGHLH